MRTRSRRPKSFEFLAIPALLLAAPALAQATPSEALPLERLHLATDVQGVLSVEGGAVQPHLTWHLALWGGWSSDPLVVFRSEDGSRTGALVHDRVGGALSGSLGLFDRAQLGVELPFVAFQNRRLDAGVFDGAPPELTSTGLDSLRLVPKVQLLAHAEHAVDLALIAGLTLPTGPRSGYLGDPGVAFEPAVAVTYPLGHARLVADVGATLRRTRTLLNLSFASELAAQAGAAYRFGDAGAHPLEAALTLSTASPLAHPFASRQDTALEVRGGVSWAASKHVQVFAGAGRGLARGWGTPDWRAFAGVQLTPAAPSAPTRTLTPAPQPVVLPVAAAPVDGDLDGVDDAHDRCPAAPGVADNAGCPDPDRDGDALVDRLDACPDLAGPQGGDGCPASGATRVVGDRIDLGGNVQFATGKDVIQQRSHALLDGIATLLRAHPEFTHVRISGHTDDRGREVANLELSARRAHAVKRYLVAHGVDAARLTSEGLGSSQPVASNATEDGRQQNRRIEFHVTRAASGATATAQ